MRIRSIKPEFWVSESMGRVGRDARLVFVGLWSVADDHGRFRADARYLAGQLFPYDPDAIEVVSRGLASLREEGCVLLYEVSRSHYGEITGWKSHQKIDKPSASRLPAPEDAQVIETNNVAVILANTREPSANPREPSRTLVGGAGSREQGEEQGEEQGAGRPPQIVRLPLPRPSAPEKRHDSAEAYLAFLNAERLAAGLMPEASLHPSKFATWFSEAMMELNADGARLDATVAAFSRDPYWKKQGLPLRALLKQWRDFVPRKAGAS